MAKDEGIAGVIGKARRWTWMVLSWIWGWIQTVFPFLLMLTGFCVAVGGYLWIWGFDVPQVDWDGLSPAMEDRLEATFRMMTLAGALIAIGRSQVAEKQARIAQKQAEIAQKQAEIAQIRAIFGSVYQGGRTGCQDRTGNPSRGFGITAGLGSGKW